MRRMMAFVGILAIVLGAGRWAHLRYAGKVITRGYYVGDFLRPPDKLRIPVTNTELSEEAKLLKAAVTPEVWWLGRGSITPFPPGMMLIVRHTENGHDQIGAYFRKRRDDFYKNLNTNQRRSSGG
jgi:hypothetical protein